MIKEATGDLLKAETEAIVNAVNCVGVMGKGLALQFRQRFSEDYFKAYKRACRSGDLRIGKVQVYALNSENNPRYIVNFPTKNHWREKRRLEDVESGLKSLVETVEEYGVKSIAMPALGCGLGGLDWKDVKPLIESRFETLKEVEIVVFPPTPQF